MRPDPTTWTCLQPGVYTDQDGGLHLVVPEMLAAAGYADTPENRETLLAAARVSFAQDGIPFYEED